MTDDPDPPLPNIASAHNEWLRDEAGREYIDLCMGYGAVWLGHRQERVTRALTERLAGYAAPGYLPTRAFAAAEAALEPFLPESHFLGGIYSTGMEAMETALRAARVQTGRTDVVGFSGSTHGRSFLTAALGGQSDGAMPDSVHRLAAFTPDGLAQIGSALEALARRVALAAIVVEPIQMTGGGYEITPAGAKVVLEAARRHKAVVIFDETLTGLYRCGTRSYADLVGEWPDVLVIGKGMGNGFPCAAVVLRKGFAWDRARVRPGSTFWNHPLTCAAVEATMNVLNGIDAAQRVGEIERVIRDALGDLDLRGHGAMWCLGFPDAARQLQLMQKILAAGVVVSYYDRYLRLLPSLLIEPETLSRACSTIKAAYADTFG